MTVFDRVQRPSLDGATRWLNSEPLGPDELRGHVVLVDLGSFNVPKPCFSAAAAIPVDYVPVAAHG